MDDADEGSRAYMRGLENRFHAYLKVLRDYAYPLAALWRVLVAARKLNYHEPKCYISRLPREIAVMICHRVTSINMPTATLPQENIYILNADEKQWFLTHYKRRELYNIAQTRHVMKMAVSPTKRLPTTTLYDYWH